MKYLSEAFLQAEITNATNSGGLILITAVGHGLENGYLVLIGGVVGTTEANGAWAVTKVSNDTFTLNGSAFANTYTSGGLVYRQQRLRAKSSVTPSAAVDVIVSYKEVVDGFVRGTKTDFKKLTSTTATAILEARIGLALSIESIEIMNNGTGTSMFTTDVLHYDNTTSNVARAELATNERYKETESAPTVATATGRTALPPVP